jgi:hypothetical protein
MAENNGAGQTAGSNAQSAASGPTFQLQRCYLKDASLELPNAPRIFLEQQSPNIDVQLEVSNSSVLEGIYEVVVRVTATAKLGDKVLFLVEGKQGGIFEIRNVPERTVRADRRHRLPEHRLSVPARQRRRPDQPHRAAADPPGGDQLRGAVPAAAGAAAGAGGAARRRQCRRSKPAARLPGSTGRPGGPHHRSGRRRLGHGAGRRAGAAPRRSAVGAGQRGAGHDRREAAQRALSARIRTAGRASAAVSSRCRGARPPRPAADRHADGGAARPAAATARHRQPAADRLAVQGLERNSAALAHEIVRDEIGAHPAGPLSGPSFAQEVAGDCPPR